MSSAGFVIEETDWSTRSVSIGCVIDLVNAPAAAPAANPAAVSLAIVAPCEKRELISDVWGKRGATYGEEGACRRIQKKGTPRSPWPHHTLPGCFLGVG